MQAVTACGVERRDASSETHMALSAFDDKNLQPGPVAIRLVLGGATRHWEQLITRITAEYSPITRHWHFAGPRFGWSLRLKQKDRIVLYLIPQQGQFLASVVLGEKAAQAALGKGLSGDVLAAIDAAPRYAEGRGIRRAVATAKDARAVRQIVALKMGA